jgi:hypothetical protein
MLHESPGKGRDILEKLTEILIKEEKFKNLKK